MTIVLILLSCFPASASSFADHLQSPQKAPPLVFEDADDRQHALTDYRGHFVLLNIWATWCGPCVHEMPSLDALQKNFPKQELIVLPLSEDRGDAIVGAFYQRHGLTHLPIAIDSAGIAPSVLNIEGLPTTFLLNPQGQIIGRFDSGADWDSPHALAFLQAQVNAPQHP